MINTATLGSFIYDHRRILRLSRVELAKLITKNGYECTDSAINHWENGRAEVPIEDPAFSRALAIALKVLPSELIKASGLLKGMTSEELTEVLKKFSPLTLQLLEQASPKDIKRLDVIIQAVLFEDK